MYTHQSLAPAVQPLLSELGVWRQFLALNPVPSHGTRSLWGDAEPHVHSHLTSRWGCGWHVDRRAFDCMLAEAASAVGAVLRCDTTAIRCDTRATGWALTLREGTDEGSRERLSSIHATVVIDATGRAAALGSSVGARRLPLDTLVAVATEFGGIATGSEGYVMIETTADGWWYTAPVPDGRLMAMLMTDGDLCGRRHLGGGIAGEQGLGDPVRGVAALRRVGRRGHGGARRAGLRARVADERRPDGTAREGCGDQCRSPWPSVRISSCLLLWKKCSAGLRRRPPR